MFDLIRAIDRALARLGAAIVQDDPNPQYSVHDRRDGLGVCGNRRESEYDGIFYVCTLAPHDRTDPHEARMPSPSRKLLATWAEDGPTVTAEMLEAPHYHDAEAAADAREAFADNERRLNAWLKIIGVAGPGSPGFDPEAPEYVEALERWQESREREAARAAYVDAPELVAEVEAYLAQVGGRS